MNIYCQLSSKFFIVLVIIIRFTFGQDLTPTKPSIFNYTSSQNETKDSNITWIQIASSTKDTSQYSSTSYTIAETYETTTDDQNLDIGSGSRRKRRKRRRNKYKASSQRRQPDHYKKHSTRVQLDKPVQFLIPPDFQENLIPKETTYYKGHKEPERLQKKIAQPVRYLLPPFIDPSFVPEPARAEKKSKLEWSPNTSNRGFTKFKHTIYYSDSGNEIISNYDVKSTTQTPQPQVKHTTVALQQQTEPPRNPKQYKPIVVQPMPIQYTTQALVNNSNYAYNEFKQKEPRINNLVSNEVANAGMQVINMSIYQQQFQNQFSSPHKQFAPPTVAQPQPHQQIQQTNYQPYQQLQPPFLPNPASQVYQNEHLPVQTYNQQYPNQNYQQQTTYSRPPEIPTTTPVIEITTNRTTTPRIEPVDNFKGLDLAESKYFSDIPSEQEFAAVQNDQVIPGIAGKDYPVFDQSLTQKRRFACRGLEGYFADTSSRCQVFYICNGDGAGEPMLCPNGTLFSQELLVCDWWYNVDC